MRPHQREAIKEYGLYNVGVGKTAIEAAQKINQVLKAIPFDKLRQHCQHQRNIMPLICLITVKIFMISAGIIHDLSTYCPVHDPIKMVFARN